MSTEARQAQAAERKIAPVQGWPAGIPWSLHLEAYAGYCKRWSPQPALIEGWCRGGFSTGELDEFIPGWRERASEVFALRAEIAELRAQLASQAAAAKRPEGLELHGLDTAEMVCFYEQDFYVLSNFSSFKVRWKDIDFATSEHAYHCEKFFITVVGIAHEIQLARSAHDAFKIAERNKQCRRADWDEVKVDIMRGILRAKAEQHEYVRRKLLATGDRLLVENSWRDSYWGWGPDRKGQNMLGKLWMEVRAELRHRGDGGTHGL